MAKSTSRSGGGKSASRGGNKGGGRNSGGSGSARPLTDREQIRQWAESRGAKPTCVRGTGGGGDTGMIRLDFPGYTGENLQEIPWDEWFEQFDSQNLALLVQETTKAGQQSNFNKLVSRSAAGGRQSGGGR